MIIFFPNSSFSSFCYSLLSYLFIQVAHLSIYFYMIEKTYCLTLLAFKFRFYGWSFSNEIQVNSLQLEYAFIEGFLSERFDKSLTRTYWSSFTTIGSVPKTDSGMDMKFQQKWKPFSCVKSVSFCQPGTFKYQIPQIF